MSNNGSTEENLQALKDDLTERNIAKRKPKLILSPPTKKDLAVQFEFNNRIAALIEDGSETSLVQALKAISERNTVLVAAETNQSAFEIASPVSKNFEDKSSTLFQLPAIKRVQATSSNFMKVSPLFTDHPWSVTSSAKESESATVKVTLSPRGLNIGLNKTPTTATVPKWYCSICMLPNQTTSTKCIACDTPKPEETTTASATTSKWFCSTCRLENQAISTKCIACASPKPGETTKASAATSKWFCSTCCLENHAISTKCIACESPKPEETTKASAATSKWFCSTCLLENQVISTKCIACESPKPGETTTALATTSKWFCSTCCLENHATSTECIACDTPKPEETTTASKWFCSTCLLENQAIYTKCIACDARKMAPPSNSPFACDISSTTTGAGLAARKMASARRRLTQKR